MTDYISRADAIEAFENKISIEGEDNAFKFGLYVQGVIDKIKSLPSADAVPIHEDGTLEVKVPNAQKVGRVLVMDTDSHIGGGLFYPESADVDGEDLIIKGAKGIQDGLYNIKDGKLFKYKAKGGTVRTYPIVPSAETPTESTNTPTNTPTDLISRAEVHKTLSLLATEGGTDAKMLLSDAHEFIDALPSADAEWIPCSERLPSEKDGQVLVTKRGEVRIATYSEFSGTWYVGEMCAVGGEDPIAWKPLPKPYKGGDDE